MTSIVPFVRINRLDTYPPSPPPHEDVSPDYAYIQGHLGRYPISLIPNLDVATLIRNPMDRAISNFMFIYNRVLESRAEYSALSSIEEKLKYYLFNDEDYFSHRNIQSKFVTSSPLENKAKDFSDSFKESQEYKTRSKSWYLQEVDISINFVKESIDQFAIVDTTENIERFINKIIAWFNYNYPDLEYKELLQEIGILNKSVTIEAGEEVSKNQLASSISQEDFDRFQELNSIDFELYSYVNQINNK
jgi:hypothetical protein